MSEPLNLDNSAQEDANPTWTDNDWVGGWEDTLAQLQAQLSGSSSEAKLLNEVNKVILSDDFSYFKELSSKDSVMANKVIDRIAKTKWISSEAARKLFVKENPTVLDQSTIEEIITKTQEKKEAEKVLEKFIKDMGLTKDKELNEEFKANFEDYMQGKDFTTENIKRFSKAAYRDLNEDKVKEFESKKALIDSQASNWQWTWQQKPSTWWRTILKGNSQNDW